MSANKTVKKIYEQVNDLPEESLEELSKYIDFLKFKVHASAAEEQPSPPLRIITLGGLLTGYDFSPEFVAEARRELWKKFLVAQP